MARATKPDAQTTMTGTTEVSETSGPSSDPWRSSSWIAAKTASM